MKKIFAPAFFFAGWMALMMYDIPAKGSFLPALGRFLNPFVGVWQNVVPRTIADHVKANIPGEVKVLFDERAIPHIYAAQTTDAVYAQGYLHAAHRLFAMDLTTRAAAGRLSELLGPRTLPYDRKQRERGFEHSAIQKAEYWKNFEGNQALIDAYVQGVNDYVHSLSYKDWPFEYKLLSHAPAEWSVLQCALVQTSMAISLCLSEDDLEYTNALENLSPEDYEFLYPDHNSKESPIIPADVKWDFNPAHPTGADPGSPKVIKHKARENEHDLIGSNSWAVSPGKTKNGFAIVANDPHLNLTLPNIWYELEIHTPDMHVHGVSLPGLPFVILGFNDSIAWGSTNSGQDVLDWYNITWQDSARQKYLLDGEYVAATMRPEIIEVRGTKPHIDTIRYTRWGPVTHTDEHKDMAMKWIGHQKATSNDVDYLRKINKAKNLADYRDAVASFQYPAQNKVFGSVQGDIAISVAGVIPLRAEGLGESVTAGDKSLNDWKGFIPFEEAPFVINPSRGYVSSANQIPADTSYPYPLLGKRYFEDYRGRTVNLLLDTARTITPGYMREMQQNDFNLHAAELLPLFLKAVQEKGCIAAHDQHYVRMLSHWNYRCHRDSLSPVFYKIWNAAFETITWDELDTLGLMRPEAWRTIEIARDHPDNKYFDRMETVDIKETMPDIACLAFSAMLDSLSQWSADQKLTWGAYKHSAISHLARLPGFGADFISTSGGKYMLNAMSKSFGPSWRMVAEMSTPPKAWVNYPGGQSGDPASPHYRDFLEKYFDGHYYEVTLQHDPAGWTPVTQLTIQPK